MSGEEKGIVILPLSLDGDNTSELIDNSDNKSEGNMTLEDSQTSSQLNLNFELS